MAGGHAWQEGGVCGWGMCGGGCALPGSMHGQGGVHCWGACVAWGKGLCGWGACMAGGCAWQGAGGIRDMHAPTPCSPGRYDGYGIWSMSRWYASYWKAFLLPSANGPYLFTHDGKKVINKKAFQ